MTDRKIFLILCTILSVFAAKSQDRRNIEVVKTSGGITLDGALDEAAWQLVTPSTDFNQNFPFDSIKAVSQTEVRLLYDEVNLYVSAKCYFSNGSGVVVPSLKRDFDYGVADVFGIFIDPFNDHVNGFAFLMSPQGVMIEGLLANGGAFGPETFWDNKWAGDAKIYDNYWVVEMAIPFRTLRYDHERLEWGVNFLRHDTQVPEASTWSKVPRNFESSSLAFTGAMNFQGDLPKSVRLVSIIPSVLGTYGEEYVDTTFTTLKPQASLDAKVAVTSSLNLDLTFNPNFAQVEVDRQVTNLTRFSVFFPERRTFFLENSDLFERFGFRQIRPFFSRRIGLYEGETIPIIAGARLSGKVNDRLRIGLMNMQTEGRADLELKANNYTVAAFQHQVFGLNNISGIFVNRQAFNSDNQISEGDYNRIVGVDYDIYTKSNKVRGKVYYHRSLDPDHKREVSSNAAWLLYSTKKLRMMWNHEYVGQNYVADVGFVRRNRMYDPVNDSFLPITYWRLEPVLEYIFNPNGKIINRHGPGLYMDQYMNSRFQTTDYIIRAKYEFEFQNTSYLRLSHEEKFTWLLFDTDVTFTDSKPLPTGRYYYRDFGIFYEGDRRKRLAGSGSIDWGSYYTGTRLRLVTNLAYRAQPWGIFSVSYQRNEIRQQEGYPNAFIDLLGLRVDLSFTKSLFFTNFIQYNAQGNILNMNTRFQWRFRPMSDFFIVYADNYDTQFNVQRRSLVGKLVMWFNL